MSAKEAPPSATPTNTLRFGSFGARSTPSRLWSSRVEADDSAELELPPVMVPDCEPPTVLDSRLTVTPREVLGTPQPAAQVTRQTLSDSGTVTVGFRASMISMTGGSLGPSRLTASGGRGQEVRSARPHASGSVLSGEAPEQEVCGALSHPVIPSELGERCGPEARDLPSSRDSTEQHG